MSSNSMPSAATNATAPAQQKTGRHVLGDVSPNVRTGHSSRLLDRRPMAGSPLKRTFNATMADGSGFTYLKKRKLSDDTPLSQMHNITSQTSQGTNFVTQNALQMPSTVSPDQPTIPTFLQLCPTQPNSPASSTNNDDGHDSAEERKSFSSLINYDPASQTLAGSQSMPSALPKSPSYAELLKLRLRVALYKVITNQVDTPFEDLHVEQNYRREITQDDVEEEVAAIRREAQAKMNQLAVPRLLPAPVLLPTSYSARMIYDAPVSSSTPTSHHHAHYPSVATPRRPIIQWEKELTSSIIKGRVAEGLLGLRNAV